MFILHIAFQVILLSICPLHSYLALLMKQVKGLLQAIIIVGLICLLIVGSLIIFKQNDFLFPGKRRGSIADIEKRYSKPEHIEETFLKTVDGESIQVWHQTVTTKTLNKGPKADNILAIILTGNGDNIYGAGNHYQEWLAGIGIPSLAFSYRGYGKSSGSPSEKGLKNDIDTVYLHATEGLGAKKILIFAVSIGTGPGTYVALKNKVHTMVLVSPYESIKKVIAKKPVFKLFSPFLKTNFSNSDEFQLAKNKPFPCSILLHGADDRLIPAQHSKNLYEIVKDKSNVKLKIYEKAGHNNIMSHAREDLELEILSCLKA